MTSELVHLGHSNPIKKTLKAAGIAVSLATVTRITLTLGALLVDSDNGAGDPIRWVQPGYVTGEVGFTLGALAIPPGSYRNAWLVVYDPTNPNGLVWGSFPVFVYADVEAADPTP